MIRTGLLTFSLLISFFQFAQDIVWGKIQKPSLASSGTRDGKNFYVTRTLPNYMDITGYEGLTVISEKKVQFVFEGIAESTITGVSVIDPWNVIVHTAGQSSEKLYRQRYTKEFEPEGKPELVMEIPLTKLFVKSIKHYAGLRHVQSPDKKLHCFEYLKGVNAENQPSYVYKILDADYKPVYEQEYLLRTDLEATLPSQRLLTNSGEYFVGQNVYESKSRLQTKILAQFILIKCDRKGAYSYSLEGKKNLIEKVSLSVNAKGMMVAAALYGSEKQKKDGLVTITSGGELSEPFREIKVPFGDELLQQSIPEYIPETGLERYSLVFHKLLDDGSIIGAMEQDYTSKSAQTLKNEPSVIDHHKGDVLVYRISPEGKMDWLSRIIKDQVSDTLTSGAESVVCFMKNEEVVMFFNDNIKNYSSKGIFIHPDTKEDLVPYEFAPAENCLATVRINLLTGDVSRSLENSGSDETAKVIIARPVTDENGELYFLRSQTKKTEIFGLVKQ